MAKEIAVLTDPGAILRASLAGLGLKARRGGVKVTRPEKGKFTPAGAEAVSGIFGLAEPTPLTQAQRLATDLPTATLGLLGPTLGAFGGTIVPGALEAAETGFRTDVSGLVERAIEQASANIAEQFGFLTGPFSADLGEALTRTAADISAQLNFQASEAAAGRRLQALPLAGTLATTALGLPLGTAADVFTVGQQIRAAQQEARPGQAAANLLSVLTGTPTQGIRLQGAPSFLQTLGQGAGLAFGTALGQAAPGAIPQILQQIPGALGTILPDVLEQAVFGGPLGGSSTTVPTQANLLGGGGGGGGANAANAIAAVLRSGGGGGGFGGFGFG